MICAWTVTLSAVVGPSAISTVGRWASDMAIITPLTDAAGELVEVTTVASRRAGRVGGRVAG